MSNILNTLNAKREYKKGDLVKDYLFEPYQKVVKVTRNNYYVKIDGQGIERREKKRKYQFW